MNCIWIQYGNGQTGFAPCKQVYWHLSNEYKYCPFCGKPIKIELNQNTITSNNIFLKQ